MCNYSFLADGDHFEQFKTLAEKHFNEVEQKSGQIPFKLNIPMLKQLFDADMLLILVALDSEGMAGYFATVISEDMFSEGLASKEIGIYVRDDLRDSGICTEMFKQVEEELVVRGVTANYVTFKEGHNDTFPVKLGYRVSEIIYEKVLT